MTASKAQRAATAERRTKAIGLRLVGVDYETIAARLGYACRGAASKDVERALEANRAEQSAATELMREIELQRLDRLQAAVWSDAMKGITRSGDLVLKIIAARSRLLGLDAPVRVDANFTETTQADLELDEMIREGKAATALDGVRPDRAGE